MKLAETYPMPQAVDFEEVILGACMLESSCLAGTPTMLTSDMFYNQKYGVVYAAIRRLWSEGKPVDILTVTNELRARKIDGQTTELEYIGGAYLVSRLTNRVASSANIQFHAYIVIQKYILREIIKYTTHAQVAAHADQDAFEILERLQSELMKVTSLIREHGSREVDMNKIAADVLDYYEAAEKSASRKEYTGVTSGFPELDSITAGWQKTDLIILAARPAMGKTSFAVNLAVNAGVPVAIASLEMSELQLGIRMVLGDSMVDSRKLRTGTLNPLERQKMIYSAGQMSKLPIYVDDSSSMTIQRLRAWAFSQVRDKGCGLLIVDYLQRMDFEDNFRGSRDTEVTKIAEGLKAIAKELNIPVIALSQLSRANEIRGGDKRPQLSDLRESGGIEQAADLVVFIHRPEYYGFTETEDQRSTAGLAEIIIAKHRNGSTGTVELGFMDSITKFYSRVISPSAGLQPNNDFMNETNPF